jgi:tRNA threonylcarbamoyladenosine biosynthesis protein TsaB
VEKNRWILCIETATEVCSVALSSSGKCIAEKSITEQGSHSTQLTVFIESLLKENDVNIEDLSAVAYSSGPGSYTGLRIGLSVAKGICFGAGIPLIEVSTLLHLASTIQGDVLRFPMIDARRMEVYGALINAQGEFIQPPFACIVDEYNWEEILKDQEICFIGNGVEKSTTILSAFPNASFAKNNQLSAASICPLADKKMLAGEFADLAYHVPFYLKDANVTASKKKML